ncbi:MAG TPA: phosphatase PAP2 family protein [Stellaceae bacterium]|nr:phosphatase PAP2 family protein [Stellaceae bacterium]
MPSIWVFVTDCGDSAVTLPLAALALFCLVATRQRHLAFAWLLMVAGCAAAIGALKLWFGACGSSIGIPAIVSPSGHTAMSVAIYGGLTLLIGATLRPAPRAATYAVAMMLVVAIAISRLVLHLHDAAEVAVGLVTGLIALTGFAVAMRGQAVPESLAIRLLGWGLPVIVLMHGTRLMVEPALNRVAGAFRLVLPWCG